MRHFITVVVLVIAAAAHAQSPTAAPNIVANDANKISDADLDALIETVGTWSWFRTIRELEPEEYEKMTSDFAKAIRSGKSEEEAIALVQARAVELMANYFPAASDEALLTLIHRNWIGTLKKYKDTNSRACIAALNGALGAKINLEQGFPDLDSADTLQIAEDIMLSGASKKPVSFDKRTADEDLARISDQLALEHGKGADLLGKPNEWMDNSDEACNLLLEMYEQVDALPNKRAANVVRLLVTGSSSVGARPGKSQPTIPKAQVVGSTLASPEKNASSLPPTPTSVLTYHVVKITPGDVLNLRAGPGSNYPIVTKISAATRGITLGQKRAANGPTTWQEISVGGYTGWVNEIYVEADQP